MVGPRRILGIALALVALVGLATGCSSADDAGRSSAEAEPSGAAAAVTLVGPDEFARRIDEPAVVTINVHVPDEGSIAGTDLTIPFDQISGSDALPADLDTPLAVYCRSDNMSADAVRDLATMGYTDIVELDGGFDAWVESGRPLEPPAS